MKGSVLKQRLQYVPTETHRSLRTDTAMPQVRGAGESRKVAGTLDLTALFRE